MWCKTGDHIGGNVAGVDKLYGTHKQYLELYYYLQENLTEGLDHLYELQLCDWLEHCEKLRDYKSNSTRELPISTFPVWIDKRLLKECKIGWLIKKLKRQYGIDRIESKKKRERRKNPKRR